MREYVGLGMPWTIGVAGERVFVRDFSIEVEDVPEMEELAAAPQRRLPIVIVSGPTARRWRGTYRSG